MLRPYKGVLPTVPASCYVDESAQLIGDVVLGENASVWMNAVVRGDVHMIRIGANPFSSEYQEPGQGRIEIVTKPGSGHLRGTVNFTFRNANLAGASMIGTTLQDADLTDTNQTGVTFCNTVICGNRLNC